MKNARQRETLLAHREQMLQTEALARLREDAPIPSAGPHWSVPSVEALQALGALFEELEFKSLLTRLPPLLG